LNAHLRELKIRFKGAERAVYTRYTLWIHWIYRGRELRKLGRDSERGRQVNILKILEKTGIYYFIDFYFLVFNFELAETIFHILFH